MNERHATSGTFSFRIRLRGQNLAYHRAETTPVSRVIYHVINRGSHQSLEIESQRVFSGSVKSLKPWFLTWSILTWGCMLPIGVVAAKDEMRVYIGTYTGPKSKGIYVSRFDAKTGSLSAPELAAETKNPTFLALHPNGRFLYSVAEMSALKASRPAR